MPYQTAAKIGLGLALLGFLDAAYLTAKYYWGGIVPCSLGSCETVLSSSYSVVYGVPLAGWGALYYLSLILLVTWYLSRQAPRALGLAFGLVTGGVLVSAVLTYLQAKVLAAWCLYCVVSALITAIIFIILLVATPAQR